MKYIKHYILRIKLYKGRDIVSIKQINIGFLTASLPIIQGGMGVGVSLSGLAGAVAALGGIGVISAAQIGYNTQGFESNALKANLAALGKHLKAAKDMAKSGIIGVNIMCATRKYEEYVACAVENKADLIISGAGLPLTLPALVAESRSKIAPIVSSLKATKVLLSAWEKRYQKTADLVVIEGPKAGGHLGFTPEEAESQKDMTEEIKDILTLVSEYEDKFDQKIPVVFGGGISSKEDVDKMLALGLSGVQVGSRFVATEECDAHINFKNAYVNAKEEDIAIIKSPVGMPGRAIMNRFVKHVMLERDDINTCYGCIKGCDFRTTPYCISRALISSVTGDVENGLIFCGADTYKIHEITTVKGLLNELVP